MKEKERKRRSKRPIYYICANIGFIVIGFWINNFPYQSIKLLLFYMDLLYNILCLSIFKTQICFYLIKRQKASHQHPILYFQVFNWCWQFKSMWIIFLDIHSNSKMFTPVFCYIELLVFFLLLLFLYCENKMHIQVNINSKRIHVNKIAHNIVRSIFP